MTFEYFASMQPPILGENILVYVLKSDIPLDIVDMYIRVRYRVEIINGYFCTNETLFQKERNKYENNVHVFANVRYHIEDYLQNWNCSAFKMVMRFNPPRMAENVKDYVLRLTGRRYSYIGTMDRVCEIIFSIHSVIINMPGFIITPYMSQKKAIRYQYIDPSGNTHILKTIIKDKKPTLSELVRMNKPFNGQLLFDYYKKITGTEQRFTTHRGNVIAFLVNYHNVYIEYSNKTYTIFET